MNAKVNSVFHTEMGQCTLCGRAHVLIHYYPGTGWALCQYCQHTVLCELFGALPYIRGQYDIDVARIASVKLQDSAKAGS